MSKKTLLQRFNEKWKKNHETGCWLWVAGTSQDGYGRISHKNKMCDAHRISYELFIGPIPEGMQVCHDCDTPPCVRPDHFFLGTVLDNIKDMDNKGRRASLQGSDNPRAILFEKDIPRIRQLLAEGNTQQSIADLFGVSQGAISNIKLGNNWSTR